MKSVAFGTSELDKVSFSDRGAMPISLEDAKLWMRREGIAAEDDLITEVIEDVIDELIRITNRSLVSQTITTIYNQYARQIHLPYSPISTITSVTMLNEDEQTLLTVTDDYYLQGDTLFMKNLEGPGLEVVYTSVGDFPNGLRRAAYMSILTTYNDREDNALGSIISIPTNSRKRALRYKRY